MSYLIDPLTPLEQLEPFIELLKIAGCLNTLFYLTKNAKGWITKLITKTRSLTSRGF